MSKRITVLVAGIGGGSLGAEIGKALRLADCYEIIGCDVSPLAFGHYSGLFDRTALVTIDGYTEALLDLCSEWGVDVVVPGGEQPSLLLAEALSHFEEAGIRVAGNEPQLVAIMSDKKRCFKELARLGFEIPRTFALDDDAVDEHYPLPCIVKPSASSGGSSFVFFARTREEVALYGSYIRNNGRQVIAQEYIPLEHGGEFTVGVLSDPDGVVRGSIALKRAFPAKLSISEGGPDFLISSGVTQGHVGDYTAVTRIAESIAGAVKSKGPINIQGRVNSSGRFLPFEINPRFSASTYLRSLAGFNEIDYFVKVLTNGSVPTMEARSGWYLRGLTEVAVADGTLIS